MTSILSFASSIDGSWIITAEKHSFSIISIEEYSSHHLFEGINLTGKLDYFPLSIRSESNLFDLELEYITGSKRKSVKISKGTITSNVSSGSFFNGRVTYYVPVDPNVKFSIHYSVHEENTIFITSFPKQGFYDSKDVSYSFQLPQNINASLSSGELKEGNFSFSSSEFKEGEEILYLLIHPSNLDKEQYFSGWFEKRINEINSINPDHIPDELKKLKENGTDEELAAACFRFVQNEVRYLDVENGINAIVPRSCDFVLTNKYGDCKDMANTLVSILKYFDFEAYNCISRTNTKDVIFNFPSIGQANHMIVGLKMKGDWIFLDPTESNCLFGDPSIQIFGTETFAIGHPDSYFVQVPNSPKSKAHVDISYQLDLEKQTIAVDFLFYGKTNTLLFDQRNDPEVFDRITTKMFAYSLPLIQHDISDTLSRLHFAGALPKAFITQLSTKQIVQTDFLANMESLILFSSYSYYPLYPFSIDSKIIIENINVGKIQISNESWSKNNSENSIELNQNWTPIKSQKEFDSSLEWTTYKTITAKPLLIQP